MITFIQWNNEMSEVSSFLLECTVCAGPLNQVLENHSLAL